MTTDDFYPIAALHKDDLWSLFLDHTTGDIPEEIRRTIDELTDKDMRRIALKMGIDHARCCYWDSLRKIFLDDYFGERSCETEARSKKSKGQLSCSKTERRYRRR